MGTLGFKRLLRPLVSRWPRARQLAFSRALTRAFFPGVRVLRPPVEGKLVQGSGGLDVGDKVRVKLVGVDVERGFIDFVRSGR